jgi:hypothetical protein
MPTSSLTLQPNVKRNFLYIAIAATEAEMLHCYTKEGERKLLRGQPNIFAIIMRAKSEWVVLAGEFLAHKSRHASNKPRAHAARA